MVHSSTKTRPRTNLKKKKKKKKKRKKKKEKKKKREKRYKKSSQVPTTELNPGDIKSREVELGSHSWMGCLAAEL